MAIIHDESSLPKIKILISTELSIFWFMDKIDKDVDIDGYPEKK